MKNCPVCNRVLVKKTDQSLTCMFCGWKGKGNTQDLKKPENNAKAEQKKPETPLKIETNPETIAKQMLQQENSKLPHFVLAGAIVITFLGYMSNQIFSDKNKPQASASPVIQATDEPIQLPIPSMENASQSATPTPTESASAPSGVSTAPSASPSASPSGSSSPAADASSEASLAPPPALAESPATSPSANEMEASPAAIITSPP
ncbi:MAG: hypothetical protein AB7I41_04935 [Candidatus Sericytochromatia bacterium]